MEVGKQNFEIRPATPADARSIASVLAESFAEYKSLYTEKGFRATTPAGEQIQIRFSEGAMWVALLDGKIVGTVSVIPENEALYIRSMAVLPQARRNKIGERLLAQIEKFAAENGYRKLVLSTTPFLISAIRLYEKFGFRRGNEAPHELFGTPLIRMEKYLNNLNGN